MAAQALIQTESELRDCCAQIRTSAVVGYDTEFVGEETFFPELCLIQISIPGQLFLIDPQSVGPLGEFWSILREESRAVVVHAGREEIRFCHRGCGQALDNAVDLQIAAGLIGMDYPIGHASLVRHLLKVPLHKSETLTDWRRRPLTSSQLAYAYDDVRHLLDLWEILSERLEGLKRIDWAHEEFGHLVRRSLGVDGAGERWRKLRGTASLDRKKLAIVRAISEWRDLKAAEFNRPVRTMLRDDLIVELARRTPRSLEDLAAIRGISRRDQPGLMAAIAAARDLPPDELPAATPRDEDDPPIPLLTGFMQVVLGDLCTRSMLSSGLVATSSDLRQLVRSTLENRPLPEGLLLNTGWRKSAVLPELVAVLLGHKRVRVRSSGQASPLEYSD